MPLFNDKFTVKKTPPRKSTSISTIYRELSTAEVREQFGLDYGPIRLNLGQGNDENDPSATFVFDTDTGRWTSSNMDQVKKPRVKSHKKKEKKHEKENQKLMEENRLLKLKIEILIDMVCFFEFDTYLLLITTCADTSVIRTDGG